MLNLRDAIFSAVAAVVLFVVCTAPLQQHREELTTVPYDVQITSRHVADPQTGTAYVCYIAVVEFKVAAVLECERED